MLELVTAPDIVRQSLMTLWSGVAGFVPRLVAALVVFLVGWLISVLLGRLAYHVVRALHLDEALKRVGFKNAWERSGFKLDTGVFFYELVKWFFIVVFLMATSNILGLDQVTEFLQTVVLYIPNVLVSAIILLIGLVVAKFLEGTVKASVKAAGLHSGAFLGAITRWSVGIFSLLIAASQLQVADEIIRIVIIGLVAAGSLATGLAFGLGGTKHADDAINKVLHRIEG